MLCAISCKACLILPMVFFTVGADAFILKVALLQMQPDENNVTENLKKAGEFCCRAAERDADIALMPEMWSIGYTRFDPEKPGAREEFYKDALALQDEAVQRFAMLARALDMAIGLTYLEQFEPAPRNTLTLFDRHGEVVFTYAKVHTSDFKPMEASMTPGEGFSTGVLDTRGGPVRVGAMICFDREHPESARILMLQGAELVLTPNACRLDTMRLDQFKVRAWENAMGVAMANYPAPVCNGCSTAYDANGTCLVIADEKEGLFMASFDMDAIRERRLKTIHGNAYRRPHRYGPLLHSEQDDIWQRIDGNGQPYKPSTR